MVGGRSAAVGGKLAWSAVGRQSADMVGGRSAVGRSVGRRSAVGGAAAPHGEAAPHLFVWLTSLLIKKV